MEDQALILAIVRAVDLYLIATRSAGEGLRFAINDTERQIKKIEPIDAGCEAFLGSLNRSGYELVNS